MQGCAPLCPITPVPYSNYNGLSGGSAGIVAVVERSVDVVCDADYQGGGVWTCSIDRVFQIQGYSCVPSCDDTQSCCGHAHDLAATMPQPATDGEPSSCICEAGRAGPSCDQVVPYEFRQARYTGESSAHSATVVMGSPRINQPQFKTALADMIGLPITAFQIFDVTGCGSGAVTFHA